MARPMKIGGPMNQLRPLHHSTQTVDTWGFTQVPVSDEVIDLFERLELIYREHRWLRCGSVAQLAQRAV
jgi:hypothetical protein